MAKKFFSKKGKPPTEAEVKQAKAHIEEFKKKKALTRSVVYEKIGRLLPLAFTAKANELLQYAGREELHVESWVGVRFLESIVLSALAFVLLVFAKLVSPLISLIAALFLFVVLISLPYARLSIASDKRAKEIEVVLPSALQLMAANIRAGMTPDRAIWLSARPEFGPLMVEIKKAGAETIGGTPIAIAFENMGKRVRSRVLERTVRLVSEGMESGGELGNLLNETASEIRSLDILRKEMSANVAMYSMFIVFAALIGAPFLLAISGFFVEMLARLTAITGLGEVTTKATESGISLLTFSTSITPQFLLYFSIAVITITNFFSALLMGLIRYGDEKRGLELAPIFIVIGIVIFLVVKIFVSNTFGAVFAA